MGRVVPERMTDAHEGDLVVFLIGMRVNKPWLVRRWWPVFAAMGPMLRELSADPDSGLLGFRVALEPGGPLLVQYWSSSEALVAYARSADSAHRPAWAEFNRRARAGGGAAGIWHETYVVPAGGHESVYVQMPRTGLAKAVGAVPVARRGDTARERLTQGDAAPR